MKKRNAKVIQIAGIRGLLLVGFVAVCLVAGFVVFPGLVAMHLWNYAVSFTYFIPAINIYQGILENLLNLNRLLICSCVSADCLFH